MVYKHSSVVEAYDILGLDQDASLEVVKSTYKQLALKTHPDKNPGDADATAQFQRISEAYNTLLKHLDRSTAPSHSHSHSHFHTHSHSHDHSHGFYHPFGYEDDDYDDEDYYDDDEFDDYDSEFEESMDFYRFLFEEVLRGRASRYAQSQYHRAHQRPSTPPETQQQYAERLRRTREEQEQAAERRAREEAHRKANQEKERERERREAEQRQRVKNTEKKAKAEASRKSAEQRALAQQQQQQVRRSEVFAAARRNDAAAVKKGVYEDDVDATGGEFRKNSDSAGFAKNHPRDAKETLLHIAASNGDLELIEWLGSHGADAEERNEEDLTAFHVALQGGHAKIANHLFELYPPDDDEYAAIYRSPETGSNFQLALESKEPEMVWLVFDKHLYTEEEMDQAWGVVNSKAFKSTISPTRKYNEFVNLFTTYGKSAQSRRPRPTVTVEGGRSHTASPLSAASEYAQTPLSTSPSANNTRSSRGQHNRRGSYRPHNDQHRPSSPAIEPGSAQAGGSPHDGQKSQSSNCRGRGRGRGRGQFRGRGRGRGRGEAPVAA